MKGHFKAEHEFVSNVQLKLTWPLEMADVNARIQLIFQSNR